MSRKQPTASERKRKADAGSKARRKGKIIKKGISRDELNKERMLKAKRKR